MTVPPWRLAIVATAALTLLGAPAAADSSGTSPPSSTPTVAAKVTATRPSAPPIRTASSGTVGGAVTAVVRWATPARTGGAAVTFYQIRAYRLDPSNRVVRIHHASSQVPRARALSVKLPRGRYKFRVQAWNKVGGSPWSNASRIVTAR